MSALGHIVAIGTDKARQERMLLRFHSIKEESVAQVDVWYKIDTPLLCGIVAFKGTLSVQDFISYKHNRFLFFSP